MTPDQLAALFSPDLNLSPEARAIIAYVASIGGGEIPYPRLMRVLQVGDVKKLRRAVAEAEDSTWINVEKQTGKGHFPSFTFTPPKNGSLKDDSLPKNGSVNAPLTTTTDYLPTADEKPDVEKPRNGPRAEPPRPAELDRVREYLGPHAGAVDVFVASASHGATWPVALLGKYGPSGTQRHFWRDVPPEREPAIVAEAMLNYAQDFAGKPLQAPLFESILRRVRDGAPVKEPKIRPGTEHANQRTNGSERPGYSRTFRREGTGLATLPELVQANLRKTAEKKAGAGATQDDVDRVLTDLVDEYDRHHRAQSVA